MTTGLSPARDKARRVADMPRSVSDDERARCGATALPSSCGLRRRHSSAPPTMRGLLQLHPGVREQRHNKLATQALHRRAIADAAPASCGLSCRSRILRSSTNGKDERAVDPISATVRRVGIRRCSNSKKANPTINLLGNHATIIYQACRRSGNLLLGPSASALALGGIRGLIVGPPLYVGPPPWPSAAAFAFQP